MRLRYCLRFVPLLVPLLLLLSLGGCLWLAVPEVAYEGYKYEKGSHSTPTPAHHRHHHHAPTPTPELE